MLLDIYFCLVLYFQRIIKAEKFASVEIYSWRCCAIHPVYVCMRARKDWTWFLKRLSVLFPRSLSLDLFHDEGYSRRSTTRLSVKKKRMNKKILLFFSLIIIIIGNWTCIITPIIVDKMQKLYYECTCIPKNHQSMLL